MNDIHSVPLRSLVQEFGREVAYAATDYEKLRLTVVDIARPGLQLAGFYDHFEPMRLQVLGNVEISYLSKLSVAERLMIYDRLFSFKVPAVLIARDLPMNDECLTMARKHNVTILRSAEATSTIVSSIVAYLKAALADHQLYGLP